MLLIPLGAAIFIRIYATVPVRSSFYPRMGCIKREWLRGCRAAPSGLQGQGLQSLNLLPLEIDGIHRITHYDVQPDAHNLHRSMHELLGLLG